MDRDVFGPGAGRDLDDVAVDCGVDCGLDGAVTAMADEQDVVGAGAVDLLDAGERVGTLAAAGGHHEVGAVIGNVRGVDGGGVNRGVVAGATDERVVAGTAVERVITVRADQGVVAPQPVESVSGAVVNPVGEVGGVEHVVPGSTGQGIGAERAENMQDTNGIAAGGDRKIVGGVGIEGLRMRRIDVLQVEVVGDILERVVVNAGDGRGDRRADRDTGATVRKGVSADIGVSVVVAVEVHARTDVLKGIPGHIELAGGAVRPDAAMPRGGAELAERRTGNKVVRNDDMTLSGGVEIDRAILIGAIGTSREEDAVLDGDIGGGVDAHANELRAAVGGIEDLDAIDRHRAEGADRRGALYDRLGTTGGSSGDTVR